MYLKGCKHLPEASACKEISQLEHQACRSFNGRKVWLCCHGDLVLLSGHNSTDKRVTYGDEIHRLPVTDPNQDSLARQFEAHRRHLRGVAYKLLGSLTEADDVVQEAWLRLTRPSGSPIERLRPWLTTVVARICLDQLRARRSRREEPIESFVPDLLVSEFEGLDPADEATQADMLTLGILVVLERLRPAERIAFVMQDVFGFPFERIASIVEKTPSATRQLASRARRRVRTIAPQQDSDLQAQKQAVGAHSSIRSGI